MRRLSLKAKPVFGWCLLGMAILADQLVYASPQTHIASMKHLSSLPIIVDTDMAFDDWLALYLLARRSEILAVTISGTGETYCDAGVSNARYILKLAGTPDVPVACGRTEPLNGFNSFPREWRIHSSAMRARSGGLDVRESEPGKAVALMHQSIQNSTIRVRIVSLGPLTNVAEFLREYPASVSGISDLYIMGGAVDVSGNIRVPGFTDGRTNTISEWNFYVDPAAAAQVLESTVRKFLVPLDATRFAPMRLEHLEKIGDTPGRAAEFFAKSYEELKPQIESGALYLWDVSAALCATSQQLCNFERARMKVREDFVDPDCPTRRVRCNYVEDSAGALERHVEGVMINYAVWLDGEMISAAIFESLDDEEG